jgi:hypothetical protein
VVTVVGRCLRQRIPDLSILMDHWRSRLPSSTRDAKPSTSVFLSNLVCGRHPRKMGMPRFIVVRRPLETEFCCVSSGDSKTRALVTTPECHVPTTPSCSLPTGMSRTADARRALENLIYKSSTLSWFVLTQTIFCAHPLFLPLPTS